MSDAVSGLLGMRVLESSAMPGDMVVLVRNGAELHRFIWTANALADQEKEIDALRAFIKRQAESFERTRPLCPDHRDKMAGRGCLACRAEAAERRLGRIREAAAAAIEEVRAIGQRYRDDWSNFDGRTLKAELLDATAALARALSEGSGT